jgi:cobyrinic acid a,c-diamide synthase
MILEQASGLPVYQLDLWMGGEAHCRQLLFDAAKEADLILIEGVMGLFDGESSSADLATLFGVPILTVINSAAMAQTFGAIAFGLKNYRPELPFAGVFANNVANERHYEMLAESLPDDITAFGWLGKNPEIELPGRHLGLLQATEVCDLDALIDQASQALQNMSTSLPPAVTFSTAKQTAVPKLLKGVHIAIAQDRAFAFSYRANLELLRTMGAKLTFFSPLTDSTLPPADALYLPGGYPELHLNQLADNAPMITAIQSHHAKEKPIFAECGGMLYLFNSLSDSSGHSRKMVGLLQGQGTMQKRLSNLGMQRITLPEGELRGHTFHYSKTDVKLKPLATSVPARRGRHGEAFYRIGRLCASYLHFYFPSNPTAVARLLLPSN